VTEIPGPGQPLSIHASAVVFAESGVLIRGESGAGKSALALALIELAVGIGRFARLVGDDRVQIHAEGGRLVMRGAPNVLGLIERRGVGLANIAAEPAAVAHLVVDLLPAGEKLDRLPEAARETCELAGVRLQRLAFDDASALDERARAIMFTISESSAFA